MSPMSILFIQQGKGKDPKGVPRQFYLHKKIYVILEILQLFIRHAWHLLLIWPPVQESRGKLALSSEGHRRDSKFASRASSEISQFTM